MLVRTRGTTDELGQSGACPRDVCGRWMEIRETLLRCYQQPDDATMLNVVLNGRALRHEKA